MLAKIVKEKELKENKAYTIKQNRTTDERIEKDIDLPEGGLSLIEIASLMFNEKLTDDTEGLSILERREKVIDNEEYVSFVFEYKDWDCIISDTSHVYKDSIAKRSNIET